MKERIDPQGYVRIGPLFQHRLVVEAYLGRSLGPEEHVHHKNRNRADNRIENLEVVLQADHNRMHSRMKGDRLTEKTPTTGPIKRRKKRRIGWGYYRPKF